MEWRYNAKWCAWTFEKYTQMVKREKQNKKKSVYYMGSWAELSYWIPEFFHAGGLHKVSKRPNHTVLLRQEKKQKKFFFQPHVGVYPDFFVFPFNRIIYFVNLPSFLYFVFLFYSFFFEGKKYFIFVLYLLLKESLYIFSNNLCLSQLPLPPPLHTKAIPIKFLCIPPSLSHTTIQKAWPTEEKRREKVLLLLLGRRIKNNNIHMYKGERKKKKEH
jgi:hypothetical protein